jgi:hypothetical protein
MQTRTNNHDIEDKICYQITQACNNVNVKDAPRFDKWDQTNFKGTSWADKIIALD